MPHEIVIDWNGSLGYINAIKPVAKPDPLRYMAEKGLRSVQHLAGIAVLYLPFRQRTTAARAWLMPLEIDQIG